MSLVNGSANDESDDIISEEQLYDYFCEAVAGTEHSLPSYEEIPSLVDHTIADYALAHSDVAQRLADALCVMVYAYCCAAYKREAERLFADMQSGKKK